MRRSVYRLGRGLQLAALIVLPAAIWAGEIRHSEAESIGILVGAIVLFFAGFLACQLANR